MKEVGNIRGTWETRCEMTDYIYYGRTLHTNSHALNQEKNYDWNKDSK